MANGEGKRICRRSNYERKVEHIQDVMAYILSKLPLKHLLQWKTVAKMWKNLIGEHYFAKLHFSNSRKNPKLIAYIYKKVPDPGPRLYLIDETGSSMPFSRFPVYLGDDSSLDDDGIAIFELVCSFNGLICCTDIEGGSWVIWICNPFTHEFHVLPDGSSSSGIMYVSVVFDPESHKYKVLRFFYETLQKERFYYKCETYTPGTEGWTRIADVPCLVSSTVVSDFSTQVNVGGRSYWLVFSVEDKWIPTYILTVDMECDFTRVELPEFEKFQSFAHLVEFEKHLLFISVDDTKDCFLIWSLQNHQSTWSPVRKVSHGMPELDLEKYSRIVAMKHELLFVVKIVGDQFSRYRMLNLEKMTWRELPVSPELTEGSPYVFPFTESLFKCNATDFIL